MTVRSVTVNTGQGNLLYLASKIIGAPGASANRMIEAALKAYRGDDRDAIVESVTTYGGSLRGGGPKHAKIDESLIPAKDISRAGRIGLLMLTYDISREEAEELEDGRVKRGRPRKQASNA